jgi:alkaline phosphatase
MKPSTHTVIALIIFSISGACTTLTSDAQESPASWYADGQATVMRNKALRSTTPNTATAKNVILFIGDGMGISTITAARILAGQLRGESGEENELYFESFPNVALSKTYNTNGQVPDSAGTMSAMATGIKTDVGLISVNQNVVRGDCASQAGNTAMTFLERAETRGLATGVVTTARLTHATPAANYAHAMDRDFEDDRDAAMLANPGDCPDIARQLIEFTSNVPGSDGLEVALGGGRRSFLPRVDGIDPETQGAGERLDGRNLTQEWLRNYPASSYVWNKEQFLAVNSNTTQHLLGLFEPSHMQYSLDRESDQAGEPSLSEMTAKSIEILSNNEKGFYLTVEAGRIDHAHHAINPRRALMDTIELAEAVRTAAEMVNLEETLIIVTADHSHVFTIAGYPARGNPILGKVVGVDSQGDTAENLSLADDGKPYTTLGYSNGPGFHFIEDSASADDVYALPVHTDGRVDLTDVDTEAAGFHSETTVPLSSETHGGEDVAIFAIGAGSDLIRGVMEQNVIFHVMMEASQLESR